MWGPSVSPRRPNVTTRAFAAAKSARSSNATLELLPGLRNVRDSIVRVPGLSPAEAIAAADLLSQSIVAAFNAEGPGKLDASVRRRADPAPSPMSNTILAVLTYGAPLLGLAAIALLCLGWREWPVESERGPRAVVYGLVGSMAFFATLFTIPGWLTMALIAMIIPGAIAWTIVYKAYQVQRAAKWPSTQGRIVHSSMRAVQRREAEGPTKVSSTPAIGYVYSVGGVEYRNDRISIGEIVAGSPEAEAAIERYSVGRTGPVFYNPDNPKEAALMRDPPVRLEVLYSIAAGVLLLGFAIVFTFTRIGKIIDWLQPYFPPGAVVPGVLFCMVAGILMLLFLVSNRRAALAAARWPTTTGTILSSTAEAQRVFAPGGRTTTQVWWPLVEYSYTVDGRSYYSSRLAFGANVGGARTLAEATVARYPGGSQVTVYFDPANPSSSVLEPRIAFAWFTLVLTIGFFAAALFFSGWRP
jgi:Protein of unknown function (DUF3592)